MPNNKKNKILKVINLTKRFSSSKGVVDAVNNVSFEVEKGQFFGVIGESGSGKTTLGRTIIGLYDSTYGSVYFENELINLKKLSKKKRRWKQKNIQMIFQDPMSSLNGKKNVASLISEPLKINKDYWLEFKKHMKLNKEIIRNFGFKLEKIFRKKHLKYLELKLDKAYEAYVSLDKAINDFLPKSMEMTAEEIIDFIEVDYYDFLISRNNSVLKNIRNLLTEFRSLYTEVEEKFHNNEMDDDEIDLKKAIEKTSKSARLLKNDLKNHEISKKIISLINSLKNLKLQKKEMLIFTKNFISNFKKSIKVIYKDEYYKSLVTKKMVDYKYHKNNQQQYKMLIANLRKIPKTMILNQIEIDEFETFKNQFSKNIASDNCEKNEVLTEKLLENIRNYSVKHFEVVDGEIEDTLDKITNLKLDLSKEKEVSKNNLSMHKDEYHTEYVKAKEQEKKAKKVFEEIDQKIHDEMKAWRAEHNQKKKTVLAEKLIKFKNMKKKVLVSFKELKKHLFEKIAIEIEQEKATFLEKSTIEKKDEKIKDNFDEELNKIKTEYHDIFTKAKEAYDKECSEIKVGEISEGTKQLLFYQKDEFKKIVKQAKRTRNTKISLLKEDQREKRMSSTKKKLKEMLYEAKVNRRKIKNLMKESNLKRKAVEVEVKLENKQISNIKTLFGITHYPRFIIRIKAKKNHIDEIVGQYLTKVGLKPEHAYRYPHEFSGGQRQRIGIARAIITKPKLIIADEPISALDVSIQAQIVNILKDLSSELGSTLIFIAHDLSMVHYICDNIIIMSRGRVVEKGSTQEIFKAPKHPYTKELLNSVPELSEINKNLAKKSGNHSYTYDNNKEYGFHQISGKNHYILANAKQAKEWTKSE